MKKTKIEITRIECCLPLTTTQWWKMSKLDKQTMDDNKLFALAIIAGASQNTFAYCGHYGQNLFFKADMPANLAAIESAICTIIGVPEELCNG